MSFGFSAGDFIAAATLVKDIVVCLKDTGGSASEYQELMLELDTLRLALDKIEHLNVSEERQLATNAIKVAALNCQYVLRDSLTKLRKYKVLEHGTDGGGWIRSSAKKVQWEVAMKKDIQDLRAYLAAHTNSLNIRLVTEGLQAASISAEEDRQRHLEITVHLEDTKAAISDVNENVRDLSRHAHGATVARILDRLSVSNVHQRQQDISTRRQDRTGEWLLKEPAFIGWLDETGHSTVWCHGDPGTGKTIIASMVIQHLQHQCKTGDVGIAFLYCDYKDQQPCLDLVGSLIRQLVEQNVDLTEQVSKFFDTKGSPTLYDYRHLLLSFCGRFRRTYILVDALDECSVEVRAAFIPILKGLEEASVRLLVTSRPNPEDIKVHFQEVPRVAIRATKLDIRLYVRGKIKSNEIFRRRITESQFAEIVEAIETRASGMFLMAVLQLERIWAERTAAKIMKALNLLPSKLEDVYSDTIARIREQPEPDAALAFRILQWISYSKQPLTVDELCQALAVEWDGNGGPPTELDADNILDQESLVDVCAGLVVIEAESRVARLVHYTTEEYFRKVGDTLFRDTHSMIARTCLLYLSFEVFTDTEDWWDLCAFDSWPKEATQSRRKQFSLFQYAAHHWQDHLRQCQELHKDAVTETLAVRVLYAKPRILMRPYRIHPLYFDLDCPLLDCKPQECTLGLHVAASFGLVTIVAAILKSTQAPINCRHNLYGRNPLHLAAEAGHEEVTRLLLLQDSIEVDLPDMEGQTPLHLAASAGHLAIVCLLLVRGANIESRDNRSKTPLLWAIVCRQPCVVEALLEHGANYNESDKSGSTALHYSIGYLRVGIKSIPKLLLAYGAPCDAKSKDGTTPLHLSVQRDEVDTAELLLHSGANIEARNELGRTALHLSVQRGRKDNVDLLLRCGADIEAMDEKGRTALHWAAYGGQIDTVGPLLSRGATVEAMDKSDRRALHSAALGGPPGLVELLLKHGADHEAKDKDGKTALMLCLEVRPVRESYRAVVDILEAAEGAVE